MNVTPVRSWAGIEVSGGFEMTMSFLQEMAGRALKQTGSRSIEAALDYISKMGYLDPRKEQIVRVIKQTSPGELRTVTC